MNFYLQLWVSCFSRSNHQATDNNKRLHSKIYKYEKKGTMPTNVTWQDVIGRQKCWTIGERYIKWTQYFWKRGGSTSSMWFQATEWNTVNASLLLNLIDNNFLIFFNRESFHFESLLTPQNPKVCDPILVTLLTMRPHYSHSSRENATPSSGTSPLASCKGVPPPPKTVFNKNFFECLQIDVSLFLWLSVDISSVQIIRKFSHRLITFFVDMWIRSSLSYFSPFICIKIFLVVTIYSEHIPFL